MLRRGFLKALLAAPFIAKASLANADRVPISEITKPDSKEAVRLPSVMSATSCCIVSSASVIDTAVNW